MLTANEAYASEFVFAESSVSGALEGASVAKTAKTAKNVSSNVYRQARSSVSSAVVGRETVASSVLEAGFARNDANMSSVGLSDRRSVIAEIGVSGALESVSVAKTVETAETVAVKTVPQTRSSETALVADRVIAKAFVLENAGAKNVSTESGLNTTIVYAPSAEFGVSGVSQGVSSLKAASAVVNAGASFKEETVESVSAALVSRRDANSVSNDYSRGVRSVNVGSVREPAFAEIGVSSAVEGVSSENRFRALAVKAQNALENARRYAESLNRKTTALLNKVVRAQREFEPQAEQSNIGARLVGILIPTFVIAQIITHLLPSTGLAQNTLYIAGATVSLTDFIALTGLMLGLVRNLPFTFVFGFFHIFQNYVTDDIGFLGTFATNYGNNILFDVPYYTAMLIMPIEITAWIMKIAEKKDFVAASKMTRKAILRFVAAIFVLLSIQEALSDQVTPLYQAIRENMQPGSEYNARVLTRDWWDIAAYFAGAVWFYAFMDWFKRKTYNISHVEKIEKMFALEEDDAINPSKGSENRMKNSRTSNKANGTSSAISNKASSNNVQDKLDDIQQRMENFQDAIEATGLTAKVARLQYAISLVEKRINAALKEHMSLETSFDALWAQKNNVSGRKERIRFVQKARSIHQQKIAAEKKLADLISKKEDFENQAADLQEQIFGFAEQHEDFVSEEDRSFAYTVSVYNNEVAGKWYFTRVAKIKRLAEIIRVAYNELLAKRAGEWQQAGVATIYADRLLGDVVSRETMSDIYAATILKNAGDLSNLSAEVAQFETVVAMTLASKNVSRKAKKHFLKNIEDALNSRLGQESFKLARNVAIVVIAVVVGGLLLSTSAFAQTATTTNNVNLDQADTLQGLSFSHSFIGDTTNGYYAPVGKWTSRNPGQNTLSGIVMDAQSIGLIPQGNVMKYVEIVAKDNHIRNPNVIRVGQKIWIRYALATLTSVVPAPSNRVPVNNNVPVEQKVEQVVPSVVNDTIGAATTTFVVTADTLARAAQPTTETAVVKADVTSVQAQAPPVGYTETRVSLQGYQMFVNDSSYFIRGVTVDENFSISDIHYVQALGANTVRTYQAYPSIFNKATLDSLAKSGIRVIVGIPADAGSGARVNIKDGTYKDFIRQYGSHPAVLMIEFGN
ncbi:MAG TPA: hypothetical protein PLO93_02880, partial [Candidatus Omnitrophota bacterium]|nr:hypothetical protein [Candidatus Omnitrophota bacterium]